MPRYLTQEEFIEKAQARHGNKYDYTNTVFTATKENITYRCVSCDKEITQRANGHLAGYGCSDCGQKERKEKIKFSWTTYKSIAKDRHNNYYAYNNINEETFNNRTTRLEGTDVVVTCPVHGDFIVDADRHIKPGRLQGCQKCRIDKLIKEGRMPGGYCEALFNEHSYLAEKPGILYYLKIDSLYKIGITINLKNRLEDLKAKSKSEIEVIYTYETTLGTAFKLEQAILANNADIRTIRSWSTELFTECVIDNIFKEITYETSKPVTSD